MFQIVEICLKISNSTVQRNQNILGILSTANGNYEVEREATEDKFA